MAKREPKWNKYEAVILLDGLLKILKDGASRKEIITRVSLDLREMGRHRGENVDERFRNENGISYRLPSMESAVKGYTVSGIPSTKLFSEVAKIYRGNRPEYDRLLADARAMVKGTESCEADFTDWLSKKVPSEQLPELFLRYTEIETSCLDAEILKKSLFETTDCNSVYKVLQYMEQNKLFRTLHSSQLDSLIEAGRYYYIYVREIARKENDCVEIRAESQKKIIDVPVTLEDKSNKRNLNEDFSTRTTEDKRLLAKYPVIYKRVFSRLKEYGESKKSASVNEIQESIQRIGRASDIEEILDNASWSKDVNGKYMFSEKVVPHDDKKQEENNNEISPVSPSNSKHAYSNKPYETVLRENFRKGFRMNSPIEIRRFKKFYKAIYGRDPKENDEQIDGIITKLCITYKNMAYLPNEMLSEEVEDKLFAYIEDKFKSGKTNIYFQAICAEFEEDFLDYPLYKNPEALKAYLTYMGEGDGRFYINRSSISRMPNATLDPFEEIRSCLQEYDRPVSFEELFAELSHLPQGKIKHILSSNEEFIRNGKGSYFHESVIRISNEDLENVAQIIEQTIEDKDFIGGNELYKAVQVKYPYIIEDNSEITVLGLRDALKYKLGNRFSFKGNIISDYDKQLSMTDVFANYARKHENFMLAELEALAHELDSPIYFEPVYENSLRLSQEQFVSSSQANFNVEDTDRALGLECPGNYIAICQVKNFGIFPDAGFPWNSFLLEHYVAAYSKNFRLLHAGFNKKTCVGAIVRRSAGIDNFDDFIVQLLIDTDLELKKGDILKFLADAGYLSKQRYSNIEQLILRAKAQKNRGEQEQ